MIKITFTAIFAIVTSFVYTQCENCLITRGDANCDGNVNITDVILIAQGLANNLDAGDSNDDGRLDISDAIYLSHFLFQGGSKPPCPFDNPGKDCTPDNLETCCSPPLNAQNITIISNNIEAIGIQNDKWDSHKETQIKTLGGINYLKIEVKNNVSCDHEESKINYGTIKFPLNDNQGFSKKRLKNDVQNIALFVNITTDFSLGTICSSIYNCFGTNITFVDISEMKIKVDIGPKNSVEPTQTIELDIENLKEFQYYKIGTVLNCRLSYVGNNHGAILVNKDISQNLYENLQTDCDEWKVFNIRTTNLSVLFSRTLNEVQNPDVEEEEKVIVKIGAAIIYKWCECNEE